MNYYEARKRESDGRWDYTSANKRTGTHPVGYCRAFPTFNDEQINMVFHGSRDAHDAYIAKLEPFRDKYHTDGHETEAEARACYRNYLLDQKLTFYEMKDTQKRCEVCGEWTTWHADVDMWTMPVCELHKNRDSVEVIYPPVHKSFSSC